MPIILHTAFLVPRGTSQLMVCPAYEKPLLQLKFNTGQADRGLWVKTLPEIPKDLPPNAKQKELGLEAEMTRLAATYGVGNFRKVYPIDELFEKAFASCEIAVLPGAEGAVPDMAPAPSTLVDEFVELNVPTLSRDKATKLVEAGFQVCNIANSDIRAINAVTGLSTNLLRSIIEASKRAAPAPLPRGVPSAPSEMRATVEAPVHA
jgi:hypothetical protein